VHRVREMAVIYPETDASSRKIFKLEMLVD
jgi:hypothetical protein